MIRYTKHALESMTVRRISQDWAESAIMFAERAEFDPRHPERTRSYKSISAFGGRILRVVHREAGADILVITVHFDRGAKL